jgi:hypothetical protein
MIIENEMLHHSIFNLSVLRAPLWCWVFKTTKNGTQGCEILTICWNQRAVTVSLKH